jgi:hypothetical protein
MDFIRKKAAGYSAISADILLPLCQEINPASLCLLYVYDIVIL